MNQNKAAYNHGDAPVRVSKVIRRTIKRKFRYTAEAKQSQANFEKKSAQQQAIENRKQWEARSGK
jgi:hypothetical protein